MQFKSKLALPLLIGASVALFADCAAAQTYPSRQITIIVPNAPGSQLDLVPRFMAPELTKILGVPVVVENKPGAANVLGSEYVAKQAPADGYTILNVSNNTLTLFP